MGFLRGLINSFPKLISINYRLALAAAHTADDIPYLIKFKATVQTLFLFYQNSAVRMAGLHAIQEVLDDPVIKLKMSGGSLMNQRYSPHIPVIGCKPRERG